MLLPAVCIAISNCAGHPRSLEMLQVVFLGLLREYKSADDWAGKSSLHELRRRELPTLAQAAVTSSIEAPRGARGQAGEVRC